jgi:ABC-2 type transport system ATP-binding protein
VLGRPVEDLVHRDARQMIGLVPSGDRSFYLRLSGYENLLFFARLHGLRKRAAGTRALECLDAVGLADARNQRVGLYSHGMQKRLSVARALLTEPRLFLIDEATHDLDPVAADAVRALVRHATSRGTAVLWATQRLEEIRGFADAVTVLRDGNVQFAGSVPELMARAAIQRHIVHVRSAPGGDIRALAATALARLCDVEATDSADHVLLVLRESVTLGRAVTALSQAGLEVLACQAERSEVETAFLRLVGDDL